MKNNFFNDNGYLVIPNLLSDVEDIKQLPPVDEDGNKLTGSLVFDRNSNYWTSDQVENSFSRINFPDHKFLHHKVKLYLEDILDMYLLKTYTCDRFYYEGNNLELHTDKNACEISVTIQISSDSNKPWPIWFRVSDHEETKVSLNDGDSIVYNGIEIPHWRDKLIDCSYHHQLFLHYVNSQGNFVSEGKF